MKLSDLKNKKIAILGLGIENYALVKFLLAKKINCEITVCDARSKKELEERYKKLEKKIKWKLGKNFNKGLEEFDILFRSPGWPISCPGVQEALKKTRLPRRCSTPLRNNTVLSSPMKLFFELCPTKNIIGVTGTKGKGTTSSLIYYILKKGGKNVWLGGNIGVAPFEFLDKIKKNDWIVLELSSFQLEDMEVSPKIAVITNFYREHLASADPNNPNYHKSLKDYWRAKSNIFKRQKKSDKLVINKNLENKVKNLNLKIKVLYFSNKNKKADSYFVDNKTISIQNSKFKIQNSLPGEHNKENIAVAVAVAKLAGVKIKIIAPAVKNFRGLEHRIEFIKNIDEVKYYNDSFATTPQSTITALKSFEKPIILLAGGAEKNSDFKRLVAEIRKRVKFLVLLNGDATKRLRKELLKIKYPAGKMKLVYNMREAARLAKIKSINGDIILISPACASFGMFKNYKERGILFKKEVKRLK